MPGCRCPTVRSGVTTTLASPRAPTAIRCIGFIVVSRRSSASGGTEPRRCSRTKVRPILHDMAQCVHSSMERPMPFPFLRVTLLTAATLSLSTLCHVAPAQDAPREARLAWTYLRNLPPAGRATILEREARREGSLVLYGATGLDRAQFWIGEFNKRYPDVKVEFVRLQAAELYQKIATERRTGQLRADLVITTITYLDLLREVGALAPYE